MWKDDQSGKIYILPLCGNYAILIEVESGSFKEKKTFGNCECLKKIISCVCMSVYQEEYKDNKSNVISTVTTVADPLSQTELN